MIKVIMLGLCLTSQFISQVSCVERNPENSQREYQESSFEAQTRMNFMREKFYEQRGGVVNLPEDVTKMCVDIGGILLALRCLEYKEVISMSTSVIYQGDQKAIDGLLMSIDPQLNQKWSELLDRENEVLAQQEIFVHNSPSEFLARASTVPSWAILSIIPFIPIVLIQKSINNMIIEGPALKRLTLPYQKTTNQMTSEVIRSMILYASIFYGTILGDVILELTGIAVTFVSDRNTRGTTPALAARNILLAVEAGIRSAIDLSVALLLVDDSSAFMAIECKSNSDLRKLFVNRILISKAYAGFSQGLPQYFVDILHQSVHHELNWFVRGSRYTRIIRSPLPSKEETKFQEESKTDNINTRLQYKN